MQKQKGSFLLQALLALTLVFAFMPFFANKMASRDTEMRLYSVVQQIETVYNAARLFLRDRFKRDYPTGTVVFTKNCSATDSAYPCDFNAVLEPFGLPIGFNTNTVFNQQISFVATRSVDENNNESINAYINLTRGDLANRNFEWGALLRMLGFRASIGNSTNIQIMVPVEEPYSDIVLRREPDETIGFVNELDMGGCRDANNQQINCDIDAIGSLYAMHGVVRAGDQEGDEGGGNNSVATAVMSNLSLVDGTNFATPKLVSEISEFFAPSQFSSSAPENSALNLSNTDLVVENDRGNAVMSVGEMNCVGGTLSVREKANVAELHLGADSSSFMDDGEATWTFYDDVYFGHLNDFYALGPLTVGRIISAYFEPTNSSPLFKVTGDASSDDSGINVTRALYANEIVVGGVDPASDDDDADKYDSIYNVLTKNSQIPRFVNVDIILNGKSKIPDIFLSGNSDKQLKNGDIRIIVNPLSEGAYTQGCGQFFTEKSGVGGFFEENFSPNSLTYNVVCQYMFYQRLERRINKKLYTICSKMNCMQ